MEENLSNGLVIKPIAEAAQKILTYIDHRRKGYIKSMKTPWNKMNQVTMGGLEWQSIIAIAGMSGGGKTAISGQLETGLVDLNPQENIAVLNFNFEMLAARLIGRKLSGGLDLTTRELYSADENNKVNDYQYEKIVAEAKKLTQYSIHYVEMPGTVEMIKNTILKFSEMEGIKGKGIVIFLDHTLLVRGKDGDKEREVLYDLMAMFNEIKKRIKCIIVVLSQLNRDIEHRDRISEPSQQFPKKSDLFGGDALYMYSDIVLVTHRPEMLNITAYGTQQWPTNNKVFFHYLKARDGEPCTVMMENDLAHSKINDIDRIGF